MVLNDCASLSISCAPRIEARAERSPAAILPTAVCSRKIGRTMRRATITDASRLPAKHTTASHPVR